MIIIVCTTRTHFKDSHRKYIFISARCNWIAHVQSGPAKQIVRIKTTRKNAISPHEKFGRYASGDANYRTTSRDREREEREERHSWFHTRDTKVSSFRSFLIPLAIYDDSPWRVMKLEKSRNSIFRSRSIYLFSSHARFPFSVQYGLC